MEKALEGLFKFFDFKEMPSWLMALLLFFSVFILFPPEIIRKDLIQKWSSNDLLIQRFVSQKIQKPFEKIEIKDEHSHYAKRNARISPYLIGHLFKLSPKKLFFLQSLLLYPLLYFIVSKFRKITSNNQAVFFAALALSFSYVGLSFTFDTLFFDSYAYFLLTVAYFFREKWWTILVLILAFFVDERAIVAAGMIPIADWSNLGKEERRHWNNYLFRTAVLIPLFGLALWLILRKLLAIYSGIGEPVLMPFQGLILHKTKVIFALFYSFKYAIFICLMANLLLFKINKKMGMVFAIYQIICLCSGLQVDDITRSFSYGLIALIFSYEKLLERASENSKYIYIIVIVGLANFFSPNYTFLASPYHIEPFKYLFDFFASP